jgi:hypothetical protein
MSKYSNFLEIRPKRNITLLNRYFDQEKKRNKPYDVTLLISLAMPVFVITTEIIKENNGKNQPDLYKKLNDRIISKNLFNDISCEWEYEYDDSGRSFIEIESLKNPVPIINKKNLDILSVLSQIRNSLSHGGIKFTSRKDNEIAKILLISQKKNYDTTPAKTVGFHINLIPVEDFKTFLINWCTFLQSENVEEILNLIKNAA